MGGAKHALMRDRDLIPARDQSYQVIAKCWFLNDGTEEADLPAMPRKQLHHPEYDDGFPAPWPHSCDVNAV
jgi:hypothetical protein